VSPLPALISNRTSVSLCQTFNDVYNVNRISCISDPGIRENIKPVRTLGDCEKNVKPVRTLRDYFVKGYLLLMFS